MASNAGLRAGAESFLLRFLLGVAAAVVGLVALGW